MESADARNTKRKLGRKQKQSHNRHQLEKHLPRPAIIVSFATFMKVAKVVKIHENTGHRNLAEKSSEPNEELSQHLFPGEKSGYFNQKLLMKSSFVRWLGNLFLEADIKNRANYHTYINKCFTSKAVLHHQSTMSTRSRGANLLNGPPPTS